MFVCHCNVISDRQVRGAIREGATDVCAIAAACGAGAECGGCIPALCRLLREHGHEVTLPVSVRTIRSELACRTADERASSTSFG